MPLDTIENLSDLLDLPTVQSGLLTLEELAPETGFALQLTMMDGRPILFANSAAPQAATAEEMREMMEPVASLQNETSYPEVSVLVDQKALVNNRLRGDLVIASLQLLNILDQEMTVPVAA